MRYFRVLMPFFLLVFTIGCDDSSSSEADLALDSTVTEVQEDTQADINDLSENDAADSNELVEDQQQDTAEDLADETESDGVEDADLQDADLQDADLQEEITDTIDTDLEEVCVANCDDRECGDDGCGGSCGVCEEGSECSDSGLCECLPQCDGKECGDNGCGGSCGECEEGYACDDESFACVATCVPNCDGKCCGDDGCGGTCSDLCDSASYCDFSTCECSPQSSCPSNTLLTDCAVVNPEPTTNAAIEAWIQESAVPLKCDDGILEQRDFSVLVDDFGNKRLFMFGEVHGTAQLGPLSAEIFDELVRRGLVNGVTMETGYDLTEAMQTYVETGSGPLITKYNFNQFSNDMFITTLVKTTRQLYLDGYEVHIFGSDIPYDSAIPHAELQDIAATMGSDASLILDDLPPAPAFGGWITMAEFNQFDAYRDRVRGDLDAICTVLSDDALCERVEMLIEGMWCGVFSSSEAMYFGTAAQQDAFFQNREPFIYYNYRINMPNADDRVYTHMGAAHTSLSPTALAGVPSVGHRLNNLYEHTTGQVYSTTPAYGQGSSILYGWSIYQLDPEPQVVYDALASAEEVPYYLSSRLPGQVGCEDNPLDEIASSDGTFVYGSDYHAFIYHDQVSPETSKTSPVKVPIIERQEAIWAAEQEFLRRQ